MLNSMLAGPVGAISGGMICPLCPPTPTPDQVAALEKQAPGGAEATAAKIKADEADAKARVAAVKYLGTVDCTRWKEATIALVTSLRADRNECVRYAAARVLNSGCCCNKDTITALKLTVAGEDTDGNPPETSPRVKAAAFSALQNCLMKVPEVLPEEVGPPPLRREQGPAVPSGPPPVQRESTVPRAGMIAPDGSHIAASFTTASRNRSRFEDQLQRKTYAQTVNEARQTLFEVARSPKPPSTLPPGKRSMLNVLIKARQDINHKARTNPTVPPAPAPPPSDPSVVPSSFTPPADPSALEAIPAPAGRSGPTSSVASPDGAFNSDGPSQPKRGLVGLLFDSRNRRSSQ
jgi:hypothetical protein